MTQPPPMAAPTCYRHPTRETYVRCTRCDRPICPDCMREASVGHQCPECVSAGVRSVRQPRTAFGGGLAGTKGYVTKTLVALNVLMTLAAVISSGSAGSIAGGGMGGLLGGDTPLHTWGAMIGGRAAIVHDGVVTQMVDGVSGGDYYRLVTAMFLHYGLLHLLMNMWALWVLGEVLEAALGPLRFFALYMIAGIGGNVAVYLLTAPNTESAGASGAIFGMFGALFVVLRRMGRSASSVVPVLVINLLITFTVPTISIGAHIGGLITGTLVAIGLAYAPRRARTEVQVATVTIALFLLVVLTAVRTMLLTG